MAWVAPIGMRALPLSLVSLSPNPLWQSLRQAADTEPTLEVPNLPWVATLAELRFHSVARWLPEEEALALCATFQAELDRLYAVLDGQADGGPAGDGGSPGQAGG